MMSSVSLNNRTKCGWDKETRCHSLTAWYFVIMGQMNVSSQNNDDGDKMGNAAHFHAIPILHLSKGAKCGRELTLATVSRLVGSIWLM